MQKIESAQQLNIWNEEAWVLSMQQKLALPCTLYCTQCTVHCTLYNVQYSSRIGKEKCYTCTSTHETGSLTENTANPHPVHGTTVYECS